MAFQRHLGKGVEPLACTDQKGGQMLGVLIALTESCLLHVRPGNTLWA